MRNCNSKNALGSELFFRFPLLAFVWSFRCKMPSGYHPEKSREERLVGYEPFVNNTFPQIPFCVDGFPFVRKVGLGIMMTNGY